MCLASLHNQKKDNNQFKNKKQPDLPENHTVWKSDNHGIKEETLVQIGRRGGDGQPGKRGHAAKQQLADGQLVDCVAPHPCVEGTTGEQDRPRNPGFQHQENRASKPLAVKICGSCTSGKKLPVHQESPFEGPHGVLEPTNAHPLGESASGQQLEGHKSLVGSEEVTESRAGAEKVALVPLLTTPLHIAPQHNELDCPALANT